MTWQEQAITTLRFIIGDTDSNNYEYTDERITQLFLVCMSLVLFDTRFDTVYTIDVGNSTVTPDPVDNQDLMGLTSLRSACTLLGSEARLKPAKSITANDGVSTITVNNNQLANSLKDLSKSFCKKYEDALFAFNAGNSVGVAIMGPYSPGSYAVGKGGNEDRSIS